MKDIIQDLKTLLKTIYRKLSNPLYRLFRGYADEDLWGASETIAKKILPILKGFYKKANCGYPHGFKTHKDWKKAQAEMIFGLEFIASGDDVLMGKDWGKNYKRAKEGLRLLGEHFMSLWD